MKLSKEQAEAVTRLLPLPEFQVFLELLGDKSEEAMKVLINTQGDLESKQGKCQAYTEIVDAIVTAKQTFEDYQNSK